MAISYTMQKAKEMMNVYRDIHSLMRFVDNISKQEIIENFKNIEWNLTTQFLSAKETSNEERILFAYFCSVAKNSSQYCLSCSLSLFMEYFIIPFAENTLVEELDIYPSFAYLGNRVCDELILLVDDPNIQYELIFAKANIIKYLNYLATAEKNTQLLSIYKKNYNISKKLGSERFSQACHNYGHILYIIFFSNPAYQDYPERANRIFEEALSFRTKPNPTEYEIRCELSTRTTYAAHLRQNRNWQYASKILDPMLNKLERFANIYSQQKIYFADYAQCLNNSINIEEEKKQNKLENQLESYLGKAEEFLKKVSDEESGIKTNSIIALTANMFIRKVRTYNFRKKIFEFLMPKTFLQAKKILEIKDKDSENLNNQDIFRYAFFLFVINGVQEIVSDNKKINVVLPNICSGIEDFSKQFSDFLYFDAYELLLIGCFGISSLEDSFEEGVYYCFFFLTLFPFVKEDTSVVHKYYGLILNRVIETIQRNKKLNDSANALFCILKLPWYQQQFRILKSPELQLLIKKSLEIEINITNNNSFLIRNVLSAWDNLTLNMINVAKRVAIFYKPPHPISNWVQLLNNIVHLEKSKKELGGIPEYLEIEKSMLTGLREVPEYKEFFEGESTDIKFLYQKENSYYKEIVIHRSVWENGDIRYLIDSPFAEMEIPNNAEFNLYQILKGDRVICLTTLIYDLDVEIGTCKQKPKLLSSLVMLKDQEIILINKQTHLSQEAFSYLHKTIQDLSNIPNDSSIIKHFVDLFSKVANKSKKQMIWIGADSLKFFPIHLLTNKQKARWIDIWDDIVFCPSLRETYLPIQGGIESELFRDKLTSSVRILGEKDSSNNVPSMGNSIFKQLSQMENSPLIYATSNDWEKKFEMGVSPKVLSYYGHIIYGHPLNPAIGFYSEGSLSNLNQIIIDPRELTNTKRVELWGCQSAMLSPLHSEELPIYEHFAEKFLEVAEQVIATLKEVPDITAALICEYFSILEKQGDTQTPSKILKEAIQWYRKVIERVRKDTQEKFEAWAKEQKANKEKELHPFLLSQITKSLNQIREEFYMSLSIKVEFFEEKDIDKSILDNGNACYLGRKSSANGKNFNEVSTNEIIRQIFAKLEDQASWGAIIFIETAYSEES